MVAVNSESLPPPLRENPPADRYADLVMTGGVASGVVYPWAVLELARHYRFRNIGGTSVGAMAAALAAAAEYGRRNGYDNSFEVLRHLPVALAERPERTSSDRTRTRLLSLFQPAPRGRRIFRLALAVLDRVYDNQYSALGRFGRKRWRWLGFVRLLMREYGVWTAFWITPALALVVWFLLTAIADCGWSSGLVAAEMALALGWSIAGCRFFCELWCDVRQGVVQNDLGLCRGTSTEKDDTGLRLPAIVDWLHEGIQASAGLRPDEPPLTFEHLWHAPLTPGGRRPVVGRDGQPRVQDRSIHLEMITTNVSHGRPRRLPLRDRDARLFYDPKEWENFFPPVIREAIYNASEPYRPKSAADPDAEKWRHLRELPDAKMPVVVAARLSLSYPVLFSSVPVWAIDYEPGERESRSLRRCRFSDGGLCSNFPIEFFDVGWPGWPTFGIWLEKKSPCRDERIFRPRYMGQGRGDRRQPIEEELDTSGDRALVTSTPHRTGTLLKFLWQSLMTAKDWRDRSQLRMPDTRTRVVRVQLRHQEGELNLGMSRNVILRMAREQGTAAGKELAQAFAPLPGSSVPGRAWTEHLWARLCTLVYGLGDLLDGSAEALHAAPHSVRFEELLVKWQSEPPIRSNTPGHTLTPDQADRLRTLMEQLVSLERGLKALPPLPQRPRPRSDFGLRPPL